MTDALVSVFMLKKAWMQQALWHFYLSDKDDMTTCSVQFLYYTDSGNWKLAPHGVFQENGVKRL